MTTSTPEQPTAEDSAGPTLQIDVWSDLACPWCYVGKSRLDHAITSSRHADGITVVIHSFELDPSMSHDVKPNLELLAMRYGVSLAQARAMENTVAGIAHGEGLPFTADRMLANSFDVHRVLHLAAASGLADRLLGVLQRLLFSGEADAYDHAVIAEAATGLGIPRHRVEEVLAGDEYADAVRADEEDARRVGVTGVPFVVFGERFAVPGAATTEGYMKAIEQAWGEQ